MGKPECFFEQTMEALMEAIERFQGMDFDKDVIREHAIGFDEEVFKAMIKKFVEEKYAESR